MPKAGPQYKRILLKMSGEMLAGDAGFGIDPGVLHRMMLEVSQIAGMGVEVGLVIGGGNLFRGAVLQAAGLNRVSGDQVGMLATVMNALVLRDTLLQLGVDAQVLSAIPILGIAESYNRSSAMRYLAAGTVVIFAAGTGNPLFTTDSAACLRGIEIEADLVLKGTKVNGVYSDDPKQVPGAEFIPRLSYQEILARQLDVMDLTAICLCLEHDMPVRVFNIGIEGVLTELILGADRGTLIAAA